MNEKRFELPALALAASLMIAPEVLAGGTIEGRLLKDGIGLFGVIVEVETTPQVDVTDDDGRFRLEDVAAGQRVLTFTSEGVASSEPIEVLDGEITRVELSVDWDFIMVENQVVRSATRRPRLWLDAPASVSVTGEERAERESAHGQLPKLLQWTPGVELTQSGLYTFNVNSRGFNSSMSRRVLSLVDGRDIAFPLLASQDWFSLSLPLDEFSRIEFVRGPGSALYGANAFNGVLTATTKEPRYSQGGRAKLTTGELGLKRLDLRHAGSFGREWYYRVHGGTMESLSFSVSRSVTVEYPGLPMEAVPLQAERLTNSFGGLRLDKYFSDKQRLSLEVGTADYSGSVLVTGIGRVEVHGTKRPWGRVAYEGEHWTATAYWSERDGVSLSLASGAPIFSEDGKLHLEVEGFQDFAGEKGRFVLGASFRRTDLDTRDGSSRHTLLREVVQSDHEALFGQVEYDFTDRFSLVAAARQDQDDRHASQFSPKLGLVFKPNTRNTVRLSYSRAFQSPTFVEFGAEIPVAAPADLSAIEEALAPALGGVSLGFDRVPVLALGNEALEVETITGFELGYQGVLGDRTILTVDLYRNELENFITDLLPNNGTSLGRLNLGYQAYAPPVELTPEQSQLVLDTLEAELPAGTFAHMSNDLDGSPIIALLTFSNFGKVETRGIDLGLHYLAGPRWMLDFSYSWFEFEVKSEVVGEPVQGNSPEHRFAAGATYTRDDWDVSVALRWVDGFDWAAGVFVGPVESYEVLDLTATHRINDHLEVGVNVTNVFDDRHHELFGGDLVGRRALVHLTGRW